MKSVTKPCADFGTIRATEARPKPTPTRQFVMVIDDDGNNNFEECFASERRGDEGLTDDFRSTSLSTAGGVTTLCRAHHRYCTEPTASSAVTFTGVRTNTDVWERTAKSI